MSNQNQEYAFPLDSEMFREQYGMTLRDYFAAKALQGLLAGSPDADCGIIGYARDAYKFADAMMKARGE